MKKTCPITRPNFKEILLGSRVNPGFTLIELLITVSIISIIFSLGLAQYMKFNRQQILDQAVLELKTNLANAQNMALSGKKQCTSGGFDGILVEAINDKGYKISSSCDKGADKVVIGEYQFPQGVIRQGELTPILFKPLTGGTNLVADQTITLSLGMGMTGGVEVAREGKIELVP